MTGDGGSNRQVAGGPDVSLTAALDAARAAAAWSRAVILVEGHSDVAALDALAARRGRDLAADAIAVLRMAGATNIGHFVDLLGPRGHGLTLAGLYDAAEQDCFRSALLRAGLGAGIDGDGMRRLGFFCCDADLEDELIRSLGATGAEAVIEAEGELGAFRSFQNQPAQRARPVGQQLRRFMGTRSGRKIRYGRLLVEALDPHRVPEPLERVLGWF